MLKSALAKCGGCSRNPGSWCRECVQRSLRAFHRVHLRSCCVPGTPQAPPARQEGPPNLLAAEVADRLRVDVSTVYRLIRRGILRAISVGRRRVIPRDELERFLIRHRDRRIA